jgi:hypothetical protein
MFFDRSNKAKKQMGKLNQRDVALCVSRLNPVLKDEMMNALNGVVVVAGGFVRSLVAGETVNDIDVFVTSDISVNVLTARMEKAGFNTSSSSNAKTLVSGDKIPVQIITRWMFGNTDKHEELRKGDDRDKVLAASMMLQDVINSFDFTVCQAGIICTPQGWMGICSDDFYEDLCAKRLVYTKPDRTEDAGGSMLRLLKYTSRGYRATLSSISAITARWLMGRSDGEVVLRIHSDGKVEGVTVIPDPNEFFTPIQHFNNLDEEQVAKILEDRLVEIDPPLDVSILPYVP